MTTPELDCSPAAAMMIERMQTHPEDFAQGGKLYRLFDTYRVSDRDREALNAAHDKYIKEPGFMVAVLTALMAEPEKEDWQKVKFRTQDRYATGFTDSRALYGSELGNAQQLNPPLRIDIDHMLQEHIREHARVAGKIK